MSDYLLTTNRVQSSVRHETLDGRDYLVAPVIAIVAGVLNNELVTAPEIAKHVEAWNGRPVPIGHPKVNGAPISANSPDVEKTYNIGRFYNAEMDGDRLRGEIWIDVSLARARGKDGLEVLERLEKGDGIEVSTAYFRDLEEKPGLFNAQRYIGIAHDLTPDHLAILLHEIGACSWKDGCGVPRVNQAGDQIQLSTNQEHTGVMVALFPSPESAAGLMESGLPDGSIATPANELHLTLFYLGDLDHNEVQIDQGELLRRVMDFSKYTPIVRGSVAGMGRFTTSTDEETQPIFLLYDCEYLNNLRWWLADMLPYRREHGFIPHITLGYIPADTPTPDIRPEPRELVFDRIGVAWGGEVTLFALQGEAQAEPIANQSSANPFLSLIKRAFTSLFGLRQSPEQDPPANNSLTPSGETKQPSEEESMAKKDLIEKLINNKRCFLEREDMELMSENALQKMLTAMEGGCGGTTEAPATNAAAPAQAPIPQELQDLSAALKEMGGVEGLKSAVAAVHANASQRKTDLVSELKANERCAFGESDLQAMSLEQLEKLSSSMRPANYAGRGGPRGNASHDGEEQVPEPPKVIMAEAAK